MLIFRSEEHVDRWLAARDLERGGIMSPQQAWKLARGWYRDKLRPDWRRHTLDEAEALFADVGLAGSFWSLRPDRRADEEPSPAGAAHPASAASSSA
jgi:hypothetical protein